MFKLNKEHIFSAIVYFLLTMVVGSVLEVCLAIKTAGTIFGLDWKHIIDIGAMSAVSGVVTGASLLKNFLTTDSGEFLGLVNTVADKK